MDMRPIAQSSSNRSVGAGPEGEALSVLEPVADCRERQLSCQTMKGATRDTGRFGSGVVNEQRTNRAEEL
jgi:hypothetical protein